MEARAHEPLRVLTYSSLYPSPARPKHGLFVEQRLLHLLRTGRMTARVVAPVPWAPPVVPLPDAYDTIRRTPRTASRHGVEIAYPRFPAIPKVGMAIAPLLLAATTAHAVRSIGRRGFAFRMIDAHYFYPEGVAAALIARRLGVPLVVTARGSDVNLFPEFAVPRRWIRWAASACAHVVTVSEALRGRLIGLGVPAERVTTLPNGVDLDRFRPAPRGEARAEIGVEGTVLLSVGNLLEAKGHHLVVSAAAALPGVTVLVAGDGPYRGELMQAAAAAGVLDRVRLLGAVDHGSMPLLYAAADALVLASEREGMPNVVLEALACGCPVVATRVGGIPEVLTDEAMGVLVDDRTVDGVREGIRALLARGPDRERVRRAASRLGWDETVRRQVRLFERVASGSSPA